MAGIVKVYGFDVEAEVQGVLRRVKWQADALVETGGLTVDGLTHTEALAVLSALSTGTLKSVVTQAAEAVPPPPPAAPSKDPWKLTPSGDADAPMPGFVEGVNGTTEAAFDTRTPQKVNGAHADPVAATKATGKALDGAAKARRAAKATPPPEEPQDAPGRAEPVPGPTSPAPVAEASQEAPAGTVAAPAAPAAAPPAPVAHAAPTPSPDGSPPAGPWDFGFMCKATALRTIVAHLHERGLVTSASIADTCDLLKPHVPVLTRIVDLRPRVIRTCVLMEVP